MAEFQSAVNAVSCALAIQERIAGETAPLPAARRMMLRIGVNLGDVIEEHGSVFGDAVNVAARLQDMTKVLSCEAVVSDEVRANAGLPADALPQHDVEIRGRNEPMMVRTVSDARTLLALLNEEQSAAA